jgi:hypothetical protein
VHRAQGDPAAALTNYQASLAIRERLAQADPGNAGWQRDLAVSFGRVGMVESRQGTREDALKAFRSGPDIIARLAKQSPANVTLPKDLTWFDRQISSSGK